MVYQKWYSEALFQRLNVFFHTIVVYFLQIWCSDIFLSVIEANFINSKVRCCCFIFIIWQHTHKVLDTRAVHPNPVHPKWHSLWWIFRFFALCIFSVNTACLNMIYFREFWTVFGSKFSFHRSLMGSKHTFCML